MAVQQSTRSVRQLASFLGSAQHDETDDRLLQAFANSGQQASFAELLRRHGAMVRGVCKRVLGNSASVDDAWQATFLLLARKSKSLVRFGSLAGWLHAVAYRVALNERRADSRRASHERNGASMQTPSPDRQAIWNELQELVDDEVGRLPQVYREVFVRCCLENESGLEVARELGINAGTVRSRLAHARRILREKLEQHGVSLSAALTIAAVTAERVSAGVMRNTVQAASEYVRTGALQSTLLLPHAADLLKTASHGFSPTRWLAATILVFAALVGTWLAQLPAKPNDAQPPTKNEKPPEPKAEAQPDADALPAGALARLGSKRLRSGSAIQALAFDPTGKRLATWGSAMYKHDEFILWDAQNGKELGRERTRENSLMAFAWGSDGKGLAVLNEGDPFGPNAGKLSQLRMHEFSAEKKLTMPKAVPGPARVIVAPGAPPELRAGAVAISKDGKLIAVAMKAGDNPDKVLILEAEAGKTLADLKQKTVLPAPAELCWAIAFTPDGQRIAGFSGTAKNGKDTDGSKITIWNKDAVLIRSIDAPHAAAQGTRVAFTVSNSHIALGLHDGGAAIIDFETAKVRKIDTGHVSKGVGRGFGTFAVGISPDGKLLASTGRDGMVRVSDIATGKVIREFGKHYSWPEALAFTGDGKRIATAGQDGVIRVWDPATGADAVPTDGHGHAIWTLAVSRDGKTVVTNAHEGKLRIWDSAKGIQRSQIEIKEGIVSFQISPDGKQLVVAVGEHHGDKNALRTWDAATGIETTAAGLPKNIHARGFRFTPGGKTVIVFGDQYLSAWSWPDGKAIWKTEMPKPLGNPGINSINSVSISPDGRRFITTAERSWYREQDGLRFGYGADGVVDMFDTATGEYVRRLVQAEQCFRPGLYLNDGTYLHAGGGTIVNDIRGGSAVTVNGGLCVIDPLTGRMLREFAKADAGLDSGYTKSLSADGKVLFFSTHFGDIQAFEVASGHLRGSYAGHADMTLSLDAPLDVRRMVSGSKDTTALIWNVAFTPGKGKKLTADELSQAWGGLMEPDGKKAQEAMHTLIGDPSAFVQIAAAKMKPAAPGPKAEELAPIFRELDGKTFASRERASAALDKLGEGAIGFVRDQLEKEKSTEARERLIRFLEKSEGAASLPERLRLVRVVELLEHLGTPEAKAILETLAKGGPSRTTTEASDALKRIAGR